MDPKLSGWIDAGVVTQPTVGKTKLPPSPVRLEDEAATRLLDEEREDRVR